MASQIHEKELYGPIYVGGFKTVSLSSVKLMEEVLRKEEKFPSRGDMALWTDYRDMRGLGYGPFTELRAPHTQVLLFCHLSSSVTKILNRMTTAAYPPGLFQSQATPTH